jgi:hypothetical protein
MASGAGAEKMVTRHPTAVNKKGKPEGLPVQKPMSARISG